MRINLLYITNDQDVAAAADAAGVDEIFIDLETYGKVKRQKGRNTVISKHEIADIERVRSVLSRASVLVRCNPVGDWTCEEVRAAIDAGADTVMLPYFRGADEVSHFIECVASRAKTCLLVETIDAVNSFDSIVKLAGIDRVHIGLNDLHIEYDSSFMFEPFIDGKLERISEIARQNGVSFGIGGIANIGSSLRPAPRVLLAEHKRLGSTSVILSRSFISVNEVGCMEEFCELFALRVRELRHCEAELGGWDERAFAQNKKTIEKQINSVIQEIRDNTGS